MYIHAYMYTCLVSHHEQLTFIGQSKISKCGSKPLAITGWPGAENNTRAGPTAAWIMGVYVQRDMGLAGIGFANLRNLRCEQVFDSSIDTFQLAAVFAPGSNPNATPNCFQVWTMRTDQRSVRYGVFIMIFGSSLGAILRQ